MSPELSRARDLKIRENTARVQAVVGPYLLSFRIQVASYFPQG